jgi:hypothetical protein
VVGFVGGDDVIDGYDLFYQRAHITVILTGVTFYHLNGRFIPVDGGLESLVKVDEQAQGNDEAGKGTGTKQEGGARQTVGVSVFVKEPAHDKKDDSENGK